MDMYKISFKKSIRIGWRFKFTYHDHAAEGSLVLHFASRTQIDFTRSVSATNLFAHIVIYITCVYITICDYVILNQSIV